MLKNYRPIKSSRRLQGRTPIPIIGLLEPILRPNRYQAILRTRLVATLIMRHTILKRRRKIPTHIRPHRMNRTLHPLPNHTLQSNTIRLPTIRTLHHTIKIIQIFRHPHRHPPRRHIIGLGIIKRCPKKRTARPARQAQMPTPPFGQSRHKFHIDHHRPTRHIAHI
jgi:hypothetical protein